MASKIVRDIAKEAICRPNGNNPTRYQDMSEVTTNAEIVTIGPYGVSVRYDAADNIYIAEIPTLLGCAAHGDTIWEAISEIAVVIDSMRTPPGGSDVVLD